MHDNQNIYKIFKNMTRHHKIDYQRRLAEELKLRFSQNLELERQSGKAETETLSEANTNKVIEFLNDSSKNAIICDAPEENPGGEELLSLIPEPIRLRQNYEIRLGLILLKTERILREIDHVIEWTKIKDQFYQSVQKKVNKDTFPEDTLTLL